MSGTAGSGAGIPLGPFRLDHPVGRGGMGVVWLGRHEGQDVPVAVKVITGKQANTAEYHRAFHQEVRAVSALDHPGVVWIFDYGTIPAESAEASGGELVKGSPYLVMEYASRGTLRTLGRTLTWPELKGVLMSLLDALAHAHARGVLHRDLKPDNVLIASSEDLRPGFKITDFGIAFPVDDTAASEDKPVGTPQYMAPEQIRNEIDLYGPHTDLYAFGNLVWRLVTGKLPFHGLKGAALMYAQLNKHPPALEPIVKIPPGFEEFLRILLCKDPADRFRRAADAAVALARLGDPDDEQHTGAIRLEAVGRPDDDEEIDLDTATLKIVVGGSGRGKPAPIGPEVRPPLPATWRLPPTASRPLRLMGAGLGLFGLRPVPFVGRDAERDRLWKALQQVHHEGRAQAIVVRGAAGVGKSRLVQWIADRAHEVGAASVLETAFTAPDSALEGLRRTTTKFLRSHPLSPELREERFGELLSGLRLDRILVADAIELLLDPERMDLPDVQRLVLLRRVWEVLALDRPLLVWFDDAQWAPEALKLARNLLEAQETRPSRVLLVLSVLDDAVDAHTEVARGLDALLHRRDVAEVRVAPFGGDERQELVRSLLGLDRELSERVADRTGGNPLFAVQLVGDWVERKVLHPGVAGFRLEDPRARLPGSLQDVWEGRVRALVGGLEPPALELLERAAVLGREVDILEWQAACDDEGGQYAAAGRTYFNPRHARLRQALMDRLTANRLGQWTERGFVFTHALFREALVERSARAGRLREHANACASVLLPKVTDAESQRIGRLLLAAGRRAEALPVLLAAEAYRRRTAGPSAALEVLDEVEETLRAGKFPRADRGWAELLARRGSAFEAVGRHPEAARAARAAKKLAAAGQWPDLGAQAADVLGAVALAEGNADDAERHWLDAVAMLGPEGDVRATVRAWHRLRRIAVAHGDRARARDRGDEVRKALERARDPASRAAGLAAWAEHLWQERRLADARIAAEEAARIDAEHGEVGGEAKARSLLAEIAEAENQLGPAAAAWQRTVQLLEELGEARRAVLARCRLAWVESRAGRYAGARAAVEPILEEGEPADPKLRAAVHGSLALAAAGRARWERADAHLAACEACWPDLDVREVQYADVMAATGDLSLRRQQRELAARAWALARATYAKLGKLDEATSVQRRLDRLAQEPRR